ncbi:hypothetical protein ZHAS_00012236 [Anopheles sinensis]|uniref:Uncharacterized protein n=1 Tax=Anopheles sinensis TaxID=74873 RepID=A0A084W2K6_ANOSI|nr:hypothetical protein ZHAS_00012236 [Anopheles sinensis]
MSTEELLSTSLDLAVLVNSSFEADKGSSTYWESTLDGAPAAFTYRLTAQFPSPPPLGTPGAPLPPVGAGAGGAQGVQQLSYAFRAQRLNALAAAFLRALEISGKVVRWARVSVLRQMVVLAVRYFGCVVMRVWCRIVVTIVVL